MAYSGIDRRQLLSTSALLLGSLAGEVPTAAATTPGGPDPDNFAPSRSAQGWTVSRPMYWGFDNRDPILDIAGYKMSVQLLTIGPIENSFSLATDHIHTSREGDRWIVTCDALAWPGQGRKQGGSLRLEATRKGDALSIAMVATATENVRAVKLTLHALPPTRFEHAGWQVERNGRLVPPEGISTNYPSYTEGMPVWALPDAGGLAISSLDVSASPRRFAARAINGGVEAELIAEADAAALSRRFEVPVWELRRNTSLEQAIDRRCELLERTAGLKRWEDRTDVPAWARDIDLVVTLHGMHWSGYIFNDYAAMLEAVHWVTDRIEGRRVMVFLAGWEGRYYRRYGDSRADDEMGGSAGLKALVDGVHTRGARVMAMFAGNATDRRLPHFADYSKDAEFASMPGAINWSPMRGYEVDWAQMRSHVTGGAWLNPGAPAWRDHLIQQIGDLNDQYGFDGTFLDTQPNANNDRRHSPLEGLRQIADGLRRRKPDLLMATESWYDLSLGCVPMSQTPDGPYRWSERYQRRFAHVALGEPSRGSTGVHELGNVPYDAADLLATFTLPTVAFVENSYQTAPAKVEAVIAAARRRRSA